jgi:hypothetical protein
VQSSASASSSLLLLEDTIPTPITVQSSSRTRTSSSMLSTYQLQLQPYDYLTQITRLSHTSTKATTTNLSQSNKSQRFMVNEKFSIRDDEDKFGRKVTHLRRTLTADDTIPFPTK